MSQQSLLAELFRFMAVLMNDVLLKGTTAELYDAMLYILVQLV